MKVFFEHPNSVGETYFQHMRTSFGFGAQMMIAGAACLLHGFFPFLCVRKGSETIASLHSRMVLHRDTRKCVSQDMGHKTG